MRLVARINDWHTRLEPILEVQEGRRGFDVQEYSLELLNKIRSEEETEQQPQKSKEPKKQTPEKNVAEFSHMVEGKEPWEVCRYFLSSLLLTNYGNLEVVSRDPLVFKVKSTVPNFDATDALQRAEEEKEKQTEQDDDSREQKQQQPPKEQPNKQSKSKATKRKRKQA